MVEGFTIQLPFVIYGVLITLCIFIESLLNIKFRIDALKNTGYTEDKDFTLKESDVYLES